MSNIVRFPNETIHTPLGKLQNFHESAFGKEALAIADITQQFDKTSTRKWSWRKFRFLPAWRIYETWIEADGSTFEPGNCWIEFK